MDLGKGIKLEMVLIPVDEFVMGSPKPDSTVVFGRPLATLCNFGSPNGSRYIWAILTPIRLSEQYLSF